MENKFIIRNIILALVIIGVVYYIKENKDNSIEAEAIDVELVILLLLSILYSFTSDSLLWKKYSWIWQIIFILTLIAYLIRIILDKKHGWWNKTISIMVLIIVLSTKMLGSRI
jgi:Ca2+/Na+ antiporter